MNQTIKNAIIIGSILALLENILVYGVNPNESIWILIQGAAFWFSCGVIIAISKTFSHPVIQSILITVLMNIPWFIALSIMPKNYDLLLPLFIASIVFGAIGGLLLKLLNKNEKQKNDITL